MAKKRVQIDLWPENVKLLRDVAKASGALTVTTIANIVIRDGWPDGGTLRKYLSKPKRQS